MPRSECLAFGVFWIPLRKSVSVCLAAAVTTRIPLRSSMVLNLCTNLVYITYVLQVLLEVVTKKQVPEWYMRWAKVSQHSLCQCQVSWAVFTACLVHSLHALAVTRHRAQIAWSVASPLCLTHVFSDVVRSVSCVRKLVRHCGGKTRHMIWELNFAGESTNCVVVQGRGADRVCRLSVDHRIFMRIDVDESCKCRTEYRILKYGHVKKSTFNGVASHSQRKTFGSTSPRGAYIWITHNLWHDPLQSPDRQNTFNQLIVKSRITVQEENNGQRKSKEN